MKTFLSLIVALLILFNLNAQSNYNSIVNKVFNKVVLDLGASPRSISIDNSNEMSSYNFALGYELSRKLDIRMNLDYFNLIDNRIDNNNFPYLDKIYGISMGLNFKAIKFNEATFLKNTTIGFVGKFGAVIKPVVNEQVGFFYDFSTRIYFGKIPYIGFGYNHIYGNLLRPNLSRLYFTFGIDF